MNNQATRKSSDFSFCDVGYSFISLGGWGRGYLTNMDTKTFLFTALDEIVYPQSPTIDPYLIFL